MKYLSVLLLTSVFAFTNHAMASVEIELTDDIDFDVSVVWDYLASPIADSSGIVPEKEDYKMIFSLGIDL